MALFGAVLHENSDRYLVERSIRALGAWGISTTCPARTLAEVAELAGSEPYVWLIRAGAIPVRNPLAAAVHESAMLIGYAHEHGRLIDAHHDLEAKTGGLLDRKGAPPPSRVESCVCPTRFLAEHARDLPEERPLDHLAVRALSSGRRIVHAAPFDVECTEGLRVAEVVTSLHRGGAERIVLQTVSLLRRQGVLVLPVVLDRAQRSAFDEPEGTLRLWEFGRDRASKTTSLIRCMMQAGIDVAHAHLVDREALSAMQGSGIPTMVTVHNTRRGWPDGTGELGPADVSLVVACGKTVHDEVRATVDSRVAVRTLPNAIVVQAARRTRSDVRDELGASDTTLVLVCVANLRAQKRLERIPFVVRELTDRGHDAVAWIVGEPLTHAERERTRIEGAIAQTNTHTRVRLLGMRTDVPDLLGAASVFVSTSDHEGLSLAHLEAFAANLPLVLSKVGGVLELAATHERERTAGTLQVLAADSSPKDYAEAILRAVGAPRSLELSPMFREPALSRSTHDACVELAYPPRDGLLLVTNNFATGGAQKSAARLLVALAQKGRRVAAAVLEENPKNPTTGLQSLRAAGIDVFHAKNVREYRTEETCTDVVQFARTQGFRTIVFWNAIAQAKVLIAQSLSTRRIFDVSPGEMYFHSLARYFATPPRDLPFLATQDYGRLLTGVIVKYAGERERARDVLGTSVHVIPNGVELAPLRPRPPACAPEPLRVGTVARLSPDKKLEELLEAFAHVRTLKSQNVTLYVLGARDASHDTYANELRGRSDPGVVWLPETDDVRGFLQKLDVFAMVSEPQGCPNALLEAMAEGLPVVATDAGGARELIGDSGLVTPRGDAEALGEGLAKLLGDAPLRDALARSARTRCEAAFSLEIMQNAYDRLFFDRAL